MTKRCKLVVRARITSPVWASIHPVWRRGSSFPYEEYAQFSRLARQVAQHQTWEVILARTLMMPIWGSCSPRVIERSCSLSHACGSLIVPFCFSCLIIWRVKYIGRGLLRGSRHPGIQGFGETGVRGQQLHWTSRALRLFQITTGPGLLSTREESVRANNGVGFIQEMCS